MTPINSFEVKIGCKERISIDRRGSENGRDFPPVAAILYYDGAVEADGSYAYRQKDV